MEFSCLLRFALCMLEAVINLTLSFKKIAPLLLLHLLNHIPHLLGYKLVALVVKVHAIHR